MTDHPEDPFGLPPLKQPIAPLAKGEDLTQAIAHLRRALQKAGIEPGKVRVEIHVPDQPAVRNAADLMAREHDPQTFLGPVTIWGDDPSDGSLAASATILGIPVGVSCPPDGRLTR